MCASIVRFTTNTKATRQKLPTLRRYRSIVLGVALILAGCATSSPTPAPTPLPQEPAPTFVTGAPEQVLPALVGAEREASRTGDAGLLMQLWAPDARIVDSRGTGDPGDDYTWKGRNAILDRYRIAVFPAPPPPFEQAPQLDFTTTGKEATAKFGNDTWKFVQKDGRWWLLELQY